MASLTTEWTDVDALLDQMAYQEMMGQHDFVPESFGFPELNAEDHERKIMFHPDEP